MLQAISGHSSLAGLVKLSVPLLVQEAADFSFLGGLRSHFRATASGLAV
jgi:hypothetical protein